MTPNPLSKTSINLVNDPEFTIEPTWCFVCQLPHSPESFAVALSFRRNQTLVEECQGHEGDNIDLGHNMFKSHYTDCEDYDKDVNEQRQFQNVIQQQVFSDESDVEDNVCNMVTAKEEVTLRKPSREEIDQITASIID